MNAKYKYYNITGYGPVARSLSHYKNAQAIFGAHLSNICIKYNSKKAYVTDCILGLYYEQCQRTPSTWTRKAAHPENVFSPLFTLKQCKEQVAELRAVKLPDNFFFNEWIEGSVVLVGGRFVPPVFQEIKGSTIWAMPLNDDGKHVDFDTTGLQIL